MCWLRSALPALILAVVVHPALIESINAGYANDTFFHLSPLKRTGLAVLATAAATGLLFLSIKKSEHLHRLIAVRLFTQPLLKQRLDTQERRRIGHGVALLCDLPATALLFMFGISIAPQFFYTYYRTIFASLPAQWIKPPGWTLGDWQERISLASSDAMADQAIALLFWTLMFACVVNAVLSCRRPQGL